MSTPGTVSKILWHFTGGPLWDSKQQKQETTPKPANKAYEILKSIISSKELRISSYSELIKVIIPETYVYNKETRARELKYNVEREIKSSKVCCLADIPIQHLEYHSLRYGKFAIGFHRQSAIDHKFNPVLYSLHTSQLINSIYSGFTEIDGIDTEYIKSELSNIENELNNIEDEIYDLNSDTTHINIDTSITYNAENEADALDNAIDYARDSIEDIVSFIKTFNDDEFSSIYSEREWRSLKQFNFSLNDIAMIVLPRDGGYFDKLISSNLVPKNIPIIPWEDLIEH